MLKHCMVAIQVFFGMVLTASGQPVTGTHFYLLTGVYTSPGKSDAIYVYDFNAVDGSYTFRQKSPPIENPSYLAVSADNKNVYAVSEMGKGKGSISAFDLNTRSGELTFINTVSSGGDGPCYVTIDSNRDYVFAANYSGGSLSAIRVNKDGSLDPSIQTIHHSGSSINKDNQSKPHVHSTVVSPDNRYLLSCDLGTDQIYTYRIDPGAKEPLSPATPPSVKVAPGSGPRHLVFHPGGNFVYTINELNATIDIFKYDNGALTHMQTVSILAPGFKGIIEAADIHISPDGKFLYGSNREESNEIVFFSIQPSGRLQYAGRQSTLGKAPRNFAIDPTGNFLLAANQNSDEIVIFKRNKKTGSLHYTGKKINVSRPVCLKFVPVAN